MSMTETEPVLTTRDAKKVARIETRAIEKRQKRAETAQRDEAEGRIHARTIGKAQRYGRWIAGGVVGVVLIAGGYTIGKNILKNPFSDHDIALDADDARQAIGSKVENLGEGISGSNEEEAGVARIVYDPEIGDRSYEQGDIVDCDTDSRLAPAHVIAPGDRVVDLVLAVNPALNTAEAFNAAYNEFEQLNSPIDADNVELGRTVLVVTGCTPNYLVN